MSRLYSSSGEKTQETSHGRNSPLGTWKFSHWSPESTIVQWSERKAELHPLRQGQKRNFEVGTRRAVKDRFQEVSNVVSDSGAQKELCDQL
ncbi:hypothetical protein AVEN_52508-1 [Araneus ventricosus]|uniref:Uncharacterized protein n=1 Tax=Araneus ventricosus TaxID=182803 RepID=A0A4Y2SPR3_ARAVE|nr:hypothetical protein AVEN_52508-1 [Araneus ventricosus]